MLAAEGEGPVSDATVLRLLFGFYAVPPGVERLGAARDGSDGAAAGVVELDSPVGLRALQFLVELLVELLLRNGLYLPSGSASAFTVDCTCSQVAPVFAERRSRL